MSVSENLTISFDISHEQQSFRLLELPPALLASITSANPPSLSLKSAALGTINPLNTTQDYAVLCTNNQTFSVRQVQSSNSVFLIQPPDDALHSNADSPAEPNVRAIAQFTSTLELIPTSAMGGSILRLILPIFRTPATSAEGEKELAQDFNANERVSKQKALQDVPLSPHEFDEAWREVCAFEFDGQAWLPSANLLQGVWKSILSAAAVKDLNLIDKFSVFDLADIVEEDGFPDALFNAVLERVCTDTETLMSGWARLGQDKCISWVGGILLEAHPISDQGIAESEFLSDWKDQLPELWRKHAAVSALKCKYSQPSKGIIMFGISAADGSGPSAISNVSGKRPGKWHEKFKTRR